MSYTAQPFKRKMPTSTSCTDIFDFEKPKFKKKTSRLLEENATCRVGTHPSLGRPKKTIHPLSMLDL